MAIDYTSAARVFAYGNAPGTAIKAGETALMESLVTAMSRALDQYCTMSFSFDTYVNQVARATVDSGGSMVVYLPVPTVTSLTGFGYRGRGTTSWQTVNLDDLETEETTHGSTIRTLTGNYLTYRGGTRLSVQLSYSGGWEDPDDVPADFEMAARRLCWWAYQKRSAPVDKTAFPEMGMVIIPSSWPADLKLMLRNYVRWTV